MVKTKVKNPVVEQLSLLTALEPIVSYKLDIVEVPFKVRVSSSERYVIVSKRFEGEKLVASYQIAGQWTRMEVSMLHRELLGVRWQLDPDPDYEGRPRDDNRIHELCRIFCKVNGSQYLDGRDTSRQSINHRLVNCKGQTLTQKGF